MSENRVPAKRRVRVTQCCRLRLTGRWLPQRVGFVAVSVVAVGVLWATARTLGGAAEAARQGNNNSAGKHGTRLQRQCWQWKRVHVVLRDC